MSEKLVEEFHVAQEQSQMLTESMQASDNSVREIASSVRLTADALEQQTMQTTDIQASLANAKGFGDCAEGGLRRQYACAGT